MSAVTDRDTILLAVDAKHDIPEAIELARVLGNGTDGTVLVAHIHEYAVGRFGRIRLCCLDDEAEDILPKIVALLQEAGMPAEMQIQETHSGHVPRAIVELADQRDAQVIVLGSNRHTDLPLIPLGSVSHKLLHLASRPVLVVPHHKHAAAG